MPGYCPWAGRSVEAGKLYIGDTTAKTVVEAAEVVQKEVPGSWKILELDVFQLDQTIAEELEMSWITGEQWVAITHLGWVTCDFDVL